MSTPPVAGTFKLDGMLQGTLPTDGPGASDIQAWVDSAREQGLRFHLDINGSSYSIVSDAAVTKSSTLADRNLSSLLEDALNSLLCLFPASASRNAFSTIRSEEYLPGNARQTLYLIGPAGHIISEQRNVNVDTALPPPELSTASMRRMAVVALLLVLLGLFASAFFIDYRKLLGTARDQIVPLTKDEVRLEQTKLLSFITVELKGIDTRHDALIFEIKRGPGWQSALESQPSDKLGWPDFLMHQSIHEQRLKIELFNKKGLALQKGEIDITPLFLADPIEVAVVARLADRLATIVIRP